MFRAAIVMAELGHVLDKKTGFVPDYDPVAKKNYGEAQHLKLVGKCF